jgi:hypothetical protein
MCFCRIGLSLYILKGENQNKEKRPEDEFEAHKI